VQLGSRLSRRPVATVALLVLLASALPAAGLAHAATMRLGLGNGSQPGVACTTPAANHNPHCASGTFNVPAGTTITIGADGVVGLTDASGNPLKSAVTVTPDAGFVLAKFNPATGMFEVVPDNTITPGGTFALVSAAAVGAITCSATSVGTNLVACSQSVAPGTKIASPRNDVVLFVPAGFTSGSQVIVDFTSPGAPGSPESFSVQMPLSTIGTTLGNFPKPIVTSVPPGQALYVFNQATGTWRQISGNVVLGVGVYKVDKAISNALHYSAYDAIQPLALGNDPLTVGAAKKINLYAQTYPGASVTIKVLTSGFGNPQTATAGPNGEVVFTFTAPSSVAKRAVVHYMATSVLNRGNGNITSLTASQRFAVAP